MRSNLTGNWYKRQCQSRLRRFHSWQNVVHFHHQKGKYIFSEWRTKCGPWMLKTLNSTQIRLPNGSLEELTWKPVDRELWRWNVQNYLIIYWMKVGWQLTQIYVLNDGREFWRQNGITTHYFIWNCTRRSGSWEFQLFEKLTCATWLQIKLGTVWLPTHNAQ